MSNHQLIEFGNLPFDKAKDQLSQAYNDVFHEDQPHVDWESGSEHVKPNGQFLHRQARDDYWRFHAERHLRLSLKVMMHHAFHPESSTVRPIEFKYGVLGEHEISSSDVQSFNRPNVLLLIVGFSSEQLALSIAIHILNGCRWIVPFSTDVAWPKVSEEVVEFLTEGLFFQKSDREPNELQGLEFRIEEPHVPVDGNNPANVFGKIASWLRVRQELCLPAIECTGGQKPMDSGAMHAASFWGAPSYYLHFTDYDAKNRRPYPYALSYQSLELPDATFSLQTRQQIRSHFESLDFDRSLSLLDSMQDAFEDFSREVDDVSDERAALNDARQLIRQSSDWTQVRYQAASLQEFDDTLHGYFKMCCDDMRSHRQVVEGLLEGPPRLFLHYVIDEYWRLLTSLGEQSQNDSTMRQVREVQIGCVGLIELIVDALVFLPWYRNVMISSISKPGVFAGLSKGKPNGQTYAKEDEFIGKNLPASIFPVGIQRKKIELIRGGSIKKVSVFLPVHETRDIPILSSSIRPGRTDPHYKVEMNFSLAQNTTQRKKAVDIDRTAWRSHWGNYPNSHSVEKAAIDWVQFRHDIVHMRTPFFDSQHRSFLRDNVLEKFVPNFIELFYVLSGLQEIDELNLPENELTTERGKSILGKSRCFTVRSESDYAGPTWLAQQKYSVASRVPWHGKRDELTKLMLLPKN